MTVVFEGQTEIGKCDYEVESPHPIRYAGADFATVFAHTQATLSSKNLVKIEHHCFLQHGDDMPDQPWIRPEVRFEPRLPSMEEMVQFVQGLHEEFTARIRKQFPQHYLV